MAEVVLLRPRRVFYASIGGRNVYFRKKETVIRADDPWFDKGGPLERAREDFVPLQPTTGAFVFGGPDPKPAASSGERRGPGKPKGAAKGKDAAAS